VPAPPELVYLDHNATTPPHPEVLAAMHEAERGAWANPASVHRAGQRARAHLDRARRAVAELSGFDPRDVVLTSGGTEANNLALRHPFHGGRRGALVLSRLEHPSVTRVAEELARDGIDVRWARATPAGVIALEDVERALEELAGRAEVVLVSVQAANHETGVLQPLGAVAELTRRAGALLHVDAVQALGKVEGAPWRDADLLTVSAHKLRGPKGIGALVTRPGLRVAPLLFGGQQERGARPGTQSAVLAAGLTVAAERARTTPARAALATLRDRLEARLAELGAEAHIEVAVNGAGPRLAHVSNTSWPGWRGPELCAALDLEGVAVASGAACSAGTAEPSPVIEALVGQARALSAVRVSLGEETSDAEVDRALAAWARVLRRNPSVR
jgi:cysteine desulfurase